MGQLLSQWQLLASLLPLFNFSVLSPIKLNPRAASATSSMSSKTTAFHNLMEIPKLTNLCVLLHACSKCYRYWIRRGWRLKWTESKKIRVIEYLVTKDIAAFSIIKNTKPHWNVRMWDCSSKSKDEWERSIISQQIKCFLHSGLPDVSGRFAYPDRRNTTLFRLFLLLSNCCLTYNWRPTNVTPEIQRLV